MTIIDPLTVVNSTSCYSVDSVDSCSFIETPEVLKSHEICSRPTEQRILALIVIR